VLLPACHAGSFERRRRALCGGRVAQKPTRWPELPVVGPAHLPRLGETRSLLLTQDHGQLRPNRLGVRRAPEDELREPVGRLRASARVEDSRWCKPMEVPAGSGEARLAVAALIAQGWGHGQCFGRDQ
jgi:hypothetical protein